MAYVLIATLVALVIYTPQWWVQFVLNRYNRKVESNFPGNGAEFARHILDKYKLTDVSVESTDLGDHYDPGARSVRLSKDKYEGRTLTAITVAAHECGHAIQHAAVEPAFMWRSRMAHLSAYCERLGSLLLFTGPLLVLIFKVPSVLLINLLGVFLLFGISVVVQLITLPVELDASFNKAMPILKNGYLTHRQCVNAHQILKAAAWTYVAGSLAGLFNFWRWLAVLRR